MIDSAYFQPNRGRGFIGRRNLLHRLLDVSLFMANVSQLKALLVSKQNPHLYILLTFICLSMALQVIFTICMLFVYSRKEDSTRGPSTVEQGDTNEAQTQETERDFTDQIDLIGNVLVLFIIISNTIVTGFGIEDVTNSRYSF